MMALNLQSGFTLARAVLPAMIRQNRGWIVNVASRAGYGHSPGAALYSASKAGALAFFDSLADEVKPYAINVNSIVPSIFDTPANRRAMPVGRSGALAQAGGNRASGAVPLFTAGARDSRRGDSRVRPDVALHSSRQLISFRLALRNFDQLDQDLAPFRRGRQEEIDSRAVGAGARLRVHRLEREARANQLRGARDVAHFAFDLLDARAEARQKPRDGAVAGRIARGQNIQPHAVRKLQLEFQHVLIGRRLRQSRLSGRGGESPRIAPARPRRPP